MQGPFEVVVDHQIVELAVVAHLFPGPGQTLLDHVVVVRGAGAQTLGQGLQARRQDEDAGRLRQQVADLGGALPVDLENHVLAAAQRLRHPVGAGAVEVAEHLGVLQEPALFHHAHEGLAAGEVVIDPFHFALPARPGGVRYGDTQAGQLFHQRRHQGSFTGAGGGRHNIKSAFVGHTHAVPVCRGLTTRENGHYRGKSAARHGQA